MQHGFQSVSHGIFRLQRDGFFQQNIGAILIEIKGPTDGLNHQTLESAVLKLRGMRLRSHDRQREQQDT
ncbi:MAG: hypothetical protein BWX45_01235 [Deltaproteobacteria bacterium ADurb.Bin002]|nr:MAG: hypothetical protein BWX45_01235 [Deltaproteobacteria bacterium ADurb.Bin002]